MSILPDNRSVFIGDLSVYCTEQDVQGLFQRFGAIEAVKLKRGSVDRTHLSYGFVRFVSVESAQNALCQLQGYVFLGRPIK
jgi:RNA recognition motif-containing protein